MGVFLNQTVALLKDREKPVPDAPGIPSYLRMGELDWAGYSYESDETLPPTYAERLKQQVEVRNSPGYKVGMAITQGLRENSIGLGYYVTKGEAPPGQDLNTWQYILAGVTSIVSDPVTYLSFGVGGFVSQQVLKQVSKAGVKRLAARAITTGIGLGGLEAVHDPLRQQLETGDYDPLRHLVNTGKQTLLGTAAGAAGSIPKVGLPAEISTFAVGGAALEKRVPTLDDFVHATGTILGIKAANAVGKALWNVARGERPTRKEAEALAEIAPDERARVLAAADGLRQGVMRISPETKRLEEVVKSNEPSRVSAMPFGELEKGQLLTAEGAGAFMRAHPKLAAEVAADPKPTRKSFMKVRTAAPKAHVERWSADERRVLVNLIQAQEREPLKAEKPKPPPEPVFISDMGLDRESAVREPSAAKPAPPERTPSSLTEFAKTQGYETLPKKGTKSRAVLKKAYEEQQREAREEAPEATSAETPLGIRAPQSPAGFVSLDDMASAARKGISVGRAFRQRLFTARGDLPEDALQAKVRRDGWINSQAQQVRYTLQDFDRAAKETWGGRDKMSEADLLAINRVLVGEAKVDSIPEKMREATSRLRSEVDALSQHLIDIGAVEGELAATIAENKGVYLNRSYRVFDDPKWAEKVPEDVRNKMKALLRSEYPDYNEDQIHHMINALLYEGKAAESPVALIRKAKLGSKDLSILTRRKLDEMPELRALYGEYKDPRINYARSVAKLSHLIANHQFLGEVRDSGMGKWLFEPGDPKIDPKAHARIAAEASEVMHPLNGLYTRPEIQKAFEGAFSAARTPFFLRWYMKVNAGAKISKTVLSPMTHVRNLTGNAMFMVANGHWRAWKTMTAGKGALASLGAMRDPEWRAYVRHLQELGVVSDTARHGELKALVKDATRTELEEFYDRHTSPLWKKATRGAFEMYRVEDDFPKMYAFENEKARYRKAYPEKSADEIDWMASQIVRNTYPTWSMIPEGIRRLRRFPLVGTFVSFAAEVYRTGYNTIRLAEREISDPRTRAIGFQRAAGVLAASTVTAGVAAASLHLLGITRQHDADKRHFLAPWSKNSQLLHLSVEGDGTERMIDLSYTDPYEYLKKPVLAFLRGDDWQEKLVGAMWEAAEPFLGEEMLAERFLDVTRNKKRTGGAVYNSSDQAPKQAMDMLGHVAEVFVPGFAASANKVAKGLKGEVEPYGKVYDPKTESLAVFTGLRINKLDVPQALSWKARDFKKGVAGATRIVSSVASRRGVVTEAEIRQAYASTERARRETFETLQEQVSAAQRLGVPRNEVIRILYAAGVSKRNIQLVLTGEYRPYMPSNAFLDLVVKRVKTQPIEGGATIEDYSRRRDLVRRLAREQMAGTP